ncbi:hypothetical protein ACI3EY_16825 [Ornithinimicrobium sp. LYQ92]|uniref:hypothetical protein n=1 Tax=Serinicoccus sp. LYQ92 TaxID=3378798 RepID=UPI0038550219
MSTMRKSTALAIQAGKGWYWPTNTRKAHYYLADNRTVCGKGVVLVLPEDLAGFGTYPSPDDCVGCTRRVAAAKSALAVEGGAS